MAKYRRAHVAWGNCVAATAHEALGRQADELPVGFADSLACGRLEPLDALDSWFAERRAFWTEMWGRDWSDDEKPDCDLLEHPHRLPDTDEVVLWIGDSLSDQLLLAFMPELMRAGGVDIAKLRVIAFQGTQPGGIPAWLGMFNVDRLALHPPARRPDDDELGAMREAWAAAVSNDPRDLLRYIARPVAAPGRLVPKLDGMLAFYPNASSGLSEYDERVLAATRDHGPRLAYVVGNVIADMRDDKCEPIGDAWLFWRLRRLADPTLARPAVHMTGTRTELRNTEATITDDGMRMLSHELNHVRVNGIDDWIGGVHLDSRAGGVWFRTDDGLVQAT